MEWDVRIDNGQRKVCESPTGAAGQKLLVASCSRRPCLQNKPSNRRLVEQQAGRPCWSPRLTPFFCRSGAHSSQLAGKLPAASTLRRRATPGAVYLVRPPWHPGTRHQRLRESDHTCDDADGEAKPGTGTLPHLEHQPSGEYPAC